MTSTRRMNRTQRAVMLFFAMLACAGIYNAIRNLPVLSGCNFYNECPASQEPEATAADTSGVS